MREIANVPLLGRAGELAGLTEALAGAKAGRLAAAWIEGEAGIGKSRLLSEALTAARDDGFTIFEATADELERSRPFGPLLAAFGIWTGASDAIHREIHRLVTQMPPRTARPEAVVDVGYRVIEHLLALIAEAAARKPVALAVEDLHWADQATVRAFHTIVKRAGDLPIAVLATFRPLPRTPELDRLVAATDQALHLRLEPLDGRAAAGLAESLLDAPPGESLLDQIAEAAGNPLFIIELIRALRDEGEIDISSGVAEAHASPRPPTLRLTILRRINFLSDQTLDVLRVASILGSTFSLADVATVMGRSAADLIAPVREGIGAGILLDMSGRLKFRHDLIREAVYEDLPPSVRAGLHLDAARALEADGAPVLQVAEHAALGASPGDRTAVERLRRGGEEAVIVAPAVAVRLLERALELIPAADSLQQQIASSLIMPLYLTGRIADADALARKILKSRPDWELEYLVRRSLAYSLFVRGHASEAVEEYRRVVEMRGSARGESPEANHSVDVTNLAVSLMTAGDVPGAFAAAKEALPIAQNAQSDFATALALLALSNITGAQGHVTDSLDFARRGMEVAEKDPALANYWGHWALGMALFGADHLGEAETALRTGLALIEEQGRVAQFPLYHLALQLILFNSGRWDDSLAEFEAASILPVEAGGSLIGSYGRALAASISLHRGQLDVAARAIEEAERHAMRTGLRFGQDVLAFTRVSLTAAEGRLEEALALATDTWQSTAGVRYLSGYWRTFTPLLVSLAMQAGDIDFARRVTEEAEEGARRAAGIATAEAAALRCRGLLRSDADTLLRAVELLRKGPQPIERALACEDAGVAVASSRTVTDAVPLFDKAIELFESAGAAHHIARTLATLRRLGVRRGSRRPRRRPVSGWESLTPTERQAVGLVAAGLSNTNIAGQMFISRYTVETHLKHVYAKLGITSRTKLAAEAARRESRPDH